MGTEEQALKSVVWSNGMDEVYPEIVWTSPEDG